MDHSELGPDFGKFRFKFIEPSDHVAVVDILQQYLYPAMEPLGYVPAFDEDYNKFFMDMLKAGHDLSYMAVDTETGEIAAVRMVEHCEKSKPEECPKFENKIARDCFQACLDLMEDMKLYDEFDITEYPDMFGLCTVDKYRRLGLATEMYQRGLDLFKKRGFKVVKCGFISPYTRKAGYKFGYEERARGNFLEMKDSDGNVFNPKADPEGFICFGLFDIRNRVLPDYLK